MAEPAHQLDNDEVYDKSGTAPSDVRPDLKALEGGGETSEPKRGHLEAVSDDQPSREDLSEAEENASEPAPQHEDQVGRGYRQAPVTRGRTFNRWSRLSGRKKIGIGLGGGVIGGGIIALFLLFLPILRLESYLATINQRVFAAGSNAVQQRTENLFERYMILRILHLQSCGNKVTAECKADYAKLGIAGSMFNTWRDVKIENRLFDKFGLEIQSYKNPDGNERFRIIDRDGRWSGKKGEELTIRDGRLVMGKFEGGSRIFGNEWNKFINNETRMHQVVQRKSFRKYLVRKHGTKFWCFWACTQKDALDNKALDAKTRFKYKLIERTIYPFSTKYGLILDCITSGEAKNCTNDNLDKRGLDRSALTADDIKELEDFERNPKTKLSQHLIEKLLIRIGVEKVAAQGLVGSIPIAGQIYLGLSALDGMEQLKKFVENGSLGKMAANITASQYVEYYAAMRSANDEMKAGKASAAEVGAVMSQFDDGNMSAEQSLVSQAYANPDKTAYLISAAAHTSSKNPYLCANGDPIPAGSLVCPEKTLNNRTFRVEKFLKENDYILSLLEPYEGCYLGREVAGKCIGFRPSTEVHLALKGINWVISNTVGTALSFVLSQVRHIPGLDYLYGQLEKIVGIFINYLFKEAFPLPIQPDSPGRDKWDGLEAGGEVTASEFNKGGYTEAEQPYGLGGKLLTAEEHSAASQAFLDQQNYEYSQSSLVARATNLENPNSLASRFIAVMPSSWNQLPNSLLSLLSNPFKNLGAIWRPAYAATNISDISAFGVPRFGYTANDPVFKADPAIYTPEYCQKLQEKWEDSKTDNKVSGIDEPSTTNPCLLEQVVTEAGSGVFTQDDSLGEGSSSIDGGATSSAGSSVVGDVGKSSNNVACASGTKDLGVVQSRYTGELRKSVPLAIRLCQVGSISGFGDNRTGATISGGAVVNSRVSGAWQALGSAAKQAGVSLSASSSFRLEDSCGGTGDGTACASPGTSMHQLGIAIDFAGTHIKGTDTTSCSARARDPGSAVWQWLYKNAESFGFKQYTFESWHWDAAPLANRCGASQ